MAEKANAEDHLHVFITYMKRKSNIFSNGKQGVEKMVCLQPHITILNLEHKAK